MLNQSNSLWKISLKILFSHFCNDFEQIRKFDWKPEESVKEGQKIRACIYFTHIRNTNSSEDVTERFQRFHALPASFISPATKVKHIVGNRSLVALTNKPKIVAGITWAPLGGKPTRCTTGLGSPGVQW